MNDGKKYAIKICHSDRQAYEIVRIVSDKTIDVRRMHALMLNGPESGEPDALVAEVGGFCAHVTGVQRYAFASDDTQPLTRIRLGLKGWRTAGGSSFALADEPREHYDFNF